jgi:hypothetical protein
MKRHMTMNQGTDLEYRKEYETPYIVCRSEIEPPADAEHDGDFTATLWGLAKYIPDDGDWHLAIFGNFRRDGRHVEYGASVIYEDGEPIHNPHSEMIDDIYSLM